VLVLAGIVFAPSHKVEKTWHCNIHLCWVWIAARFVAEFAFPHWVVYAWFVAEIVGKLASVSLGAVVFVVEFSTDLFGRFWADNLSANGVWEEAVEAILAVSHVEMNARVVASIDVVLVALGRVRALVDCKVLICTVILHEIQLWF